MCVCLVCVFSVSLRSDPLHPAGGLPSFLGRGPAQAVPADQGWGLRREFALACTGACALFPTVRSSQVFSLPSFLFFACGYATQVTSCIFQGVQYSEAYLSSMLNAVEGH